MKKTNKFIFFSLAFLILSGCANNIKEDNTNITPKKSNAVQKETPSPAPCSNFCSPIKPPKIILTPLSVKAYISTVSATDD